GVEEEGRARPVEGEQGLACIAGREGPVKPVRVPGFEEPPAGKTERRKLVDCSYFTLEYLRSGEPVCCGLRGRLQILTIVRGAGRLVSGGSEEELAPGQTWLLPASVGEACLKPRAGLGVLLSTLPA